MGRGTVLSMLPTLLRVFVLPMLPTLYAKRFCLLIRCAALIGVAFLLAIAASPSDAASLPAKADEVLRRENFFQEPRWEVSFPSYVWWLLPTIRIDERLPLTEQGLRDEDMVLFREFLLAHGYLQVGGERKKDFCIMTCRPGVLRPLAITDRLRPAVGKSITGELPHVTLSVVRNRLISIDKVEQRKAGDSDIWRFVLSYRLWSAFPELPVASDVMKATGFVAFNRFTEQWSAKIEPLSAPHGPSEIWALMLRGMTNGRSQWASKVPAYAPSETPKSCRLAPQGFSELRFREADGTQCYRIRLDGNFSNFIYAPHSSRYDINLVTDGRITVLYRDGGTFSWNRTRGKQFDQNINFGTRCGVFRVKGEGEIEVSTDRFERMTPGGVEKSVCEGMY